MNLSSDAPILAKTKSTLAIVTTQACIGILAGLSSTGVALVSYRYLAHIGPILPNVLANRHFRPWVIIHASSAATALLCGPVQLLLPMQWRRPQIHRWLGWTYVTTSLLGGCSGLVLAAGLSNGMVTQAGFAALSLSWIYVTVQGLRTALARRLTNHGRWMVRSFALAFAAVTLRLYLPIAVYALGLGFSSSYAAISWLSWVPNMFAAELYLRWQRSPTALRRRNNVTTI